MLRNLQEAWWPGAEMVSQQSRRKPDTLRYVLVKDLVTACVLQNALRAAFPFTPSRKSFANSVGFYDPKWVGEG